MWGGGVACRVEKINPCMFGEGKTAKEINDFEVIGVGWVIRTKGNGS